MADVKTERQKVKEITDKLEEGLKELFSSEKYKSYLSTMSKFHNYSFNNTLLIALQRPDATLVAGYQAWKKNFNRHVNKGEKGIRILAPAPYKIKEERDKLDPVTGEIMFSRDGMPQTEEVEVRIPAFRAVSVFDVAQTSGDPIPELETKELLSTVEGYEDFVKAVTYVAPVPISFEDIPGSSRGFFNPSEKRIAVQEGMGESQTLKTMVHETAHSMLHGREAGSDFSFLAKDRNTREVEAESIAYTVCRHFGIDTSEYSFGYIAGWSSGKDMKELKSSLDTIRRTASDLITGIEGQIKEIQREREASLSWEMMQGQEKGCLLLIQNSSLSEYSLVSVRGMDAAEAVEALSAMNDDDRPSIAAYLESRGAWVTEIANENTKEPEEYHPDVRYNTDTNEVTSVKTGTELNERPEEPIGVEDAGADKEAQLLHGSSDRYGIYQLKDNPELDQFRFEGTEALKRMGITKYNFDAIRPENYNLIYVGGLSELQGRSQGETLEAVYEKFNIDHPADYRGHSLSVSDIVVLHEGGENSAHFVDSFGFTGLPDFMHELEGVKEKGREETTLTEETGQEVSREETQDTFGHDVQKPEAGKPEKKCIPPVYWNPLNYAVKHGEEKEYAASRRLDRECREAIGRIIKDNFDGFYLKHDIVKPLAEQYGSERIAFVLASTLQQEPWDNRFSKDNKAWASGFSIPENMVHGIDMNRELIVSSHPAVLNGFIDMFRREILEQEKEMPVRKEEALDISAHDARKSGQEKQAGIPGFVDMDDEDEIIDLGDEKNQVLAEMRESVGSGRKTSGHDVQKQEKTEITLTVAECGEFHSLGEFHENIRTVEEALAIWRRIPPERISGIPAIGINIHTPGTEPYEDVTADILYGNRIDLDILEYIPEIKGNPQAMEVIAELVAKAMPLMPEMEIDGKMSGEMEARVWEMRMPGLTAEEQLAVEIDRFTYDYDTALYRDSTQSMTENVSEIAEFLKQRDTYDITVWLAEVAAKGTEPDEKKRVMELLEKLAEYKPLARIEEMEEQNYNMVDNVLNNGAGEKARKEENKKEQERLVAKASLKNRLVEKKALVSSPGKGHEAQENMMNKQREM